MRKREFIDKLDVITLLDEIFVCRCNIKEAYDLLDIVSIKTEQDIVKPYLEKIQNKIIRQKQGGVTLADCLWEIEDYVNSLLSDQGNPE